ncbi:MAG: L,D-transpeptidase [Alistipes sp.]|nr:L,D-transpeptidase [Alistipes sp.]
MKRSLRISLLLLVWLLLGGCRTMHSCSGSGASYLIVSKQTMSLTLYNGRGEAVFEYPIACGLVAGNKVEEGDMRTPEGVFYVQEIRDAADWKHDFGDGKGWIAGAYGPYFIRLYTPPHSGIGIHGTHLPSSIGARATEGCVRLRNEDVQALMLYIRVGMLVEITPDYRLPQGISCD